MPPTKRAAKKSSAPPSKRRKGSSSSAPYDENRFTCFDNQRWYEAKCHNKTVIEKTIDADIEETFYLKSGFARLGWEPILELPGEFYPPLVHEFFANIEAKDSMEPYIKSFVRGVPIHLTRRGLAEILGVPDEGEAFHLQRGKILSDRGFSLSQAHFDLCLHYTLERGRATLNTRHMEIRKRLLLYLLGHNVLPHSSSLNEVRQKDTYLLYKLLNGLGDIPGIPLGGFIISVMREVVRSIKANKTFCFPLVLTKVFWHFGVALLDGEKVATTPIDTLCPPIMGRLGYHQVNGRWVLKGGSDGGPQILAAPPPAPMQPEVPENFPND